MSRNVPIIRVSLFLTFLAVAGAIALLASQVYANPPGRVTIWVDGVLYNAIIPMSPDGSIQFPHVPDGQVPTVADLETTDSLYIVSSNTETPLV
ncbi:MAG: hypothetical protein ACE5Q6_11375, partial [Dehalococcoidia bacterium]